MYYIHIGWCDIFVITWQGFMWLYWYVKLWYIMKMYFTEHDFCMLICFMINDDILSMHLMEWAAK